MSETIIKTKKQIVKAKCQGCGVEMPIMSPYVGDILCSKCMEPHSWTHIVEGFDEDKTT